MLRALLLAGILSAGSAAAQTDLQNLTATERAAFGREVRSLLHDEPQIVDAALNPPSPVAQQMQQEIEDDLSLLERLAPQALGDADIALFIGPDCAACERAASELQALSRDYGTTFILHDMGEPDKATLAKALGLTEPPFYVLPNVILRGHIPQVVLPRYLR